MQSVLRVRRPNLVIGYVQAAHNPSCTAFLVEHGLDMIDPVELELLVQKNVANSTVTYTPRDAMDLVALSREHDVQCNPTQLKRLPENKNALHVIY